MDPVNPTIVPAGCGVLVATSTSFLGDHEEIRCGERWPNGREYARCNKCRPLAWDMARAFHECTWTWNLALNLTLGALCTAAATNAIVDYTLPVFTIRVPPEDSAEWVEWQRRIQHMDDMRRLSTYRPVLTDSEEIL